MTPSSRLFHALLGSLAMLLVMSGASMAAEITGAGASFPYPVYAKWAEAYKEKSGVSLNYQSIGSGGGIKQIQAKTVDFGASDMPLKVEELEKSGLVQWPMIMGGVVTVINVEGIKPGELKLSGDVLADIFLGKIKMWNDPAIAALNSGQKLPAQAIAVVHRSDGSGTTFLFTSYLSKVSAEWKTKVGNNSAVEWPMGIGGKGNEGVANFVGQTPGSIGYVEYAYAKKNNLTFTQLKAHDGKFLMPESKTFQAAAANAEWDKAPGFYLVLTDQPGGESWPITGASFILMHKQQEKPAQAEASLKFFAWSFANGAKMADELDYVPMPENVVKMVEAMWAKDIKSSAGAALWPAK